MQPYINLKHLEEWKEQKLNDLTEFPYKIVWLMENIETKM